MDVAEFTSAFSVVDASPQWNTNIIQRVNRTLHENADVLLHICERIDKAGTGRISHEKFVQGAGGDRFGVAWLSATPSAVASV